MISRYIFHIDVNSAFLSWEACHRLSLDKNAPDIRNIPAVVGGDINNRHGVVVAKSAPAKALGITTGEPIVHALKKCPTLLLCRTDFSIYRKYSDAFIAILRQYTNVVEQFSIDEAWCDVTELVNNRENAISLADTIKNRIRDELNFTVNIGISSNKVLSKMASDFTKPDRIHTLFPDEIEKKMWNLPVRDLFFVGKQTESKLKNIGITTIGELAHSDPKLIGRLLKKHGALLYEYANGIDPSPVKSEKEKPKGYGNSTTVPFDVTDMDTASLIIKELSESVSRRLKKDSAKAMCISVTIRDTDFCDTSKQRTLSTSTDTFDEIYDTALSLLSELWDKVTPLRLLGVATSHIVYDEPVQYSIFDYSEQDFIKQEKLSKALDSIKTKYGENAVTRGSNFKKADKQ